MQVLCHLPCLVFATVSPSALVGLQGFTAIEEARLGPACGWCCLACSNMDRVVGLTQRLKLANKALTRSFACPTISNRPTAHKPARPFSHPALPSMIAATTDMEAETTHPISTNEETKMSYSRRVLQ